MLFGIQICDAFCDVLSSEQNCINRKRLIRKRELLSRDWLKFFHVADIPIKFMGLLLGTKSFQLTIIVKHILI